MDSLQSKAQFFKLSVEGEKYNYTLVVIGRYICWTQHNTITLLVRIDYLNRKVPHYCSALI